MTFCRIYGVVSYDSNRKGNSMSLPKIDWNDVWKSIYKEKSASRRDDGFWDKRAPEFARHAKVGDYIGQIIKIMQPQPDWSVLDIGSAAGTLAVPLASSVKHITAMEPSAAMRRLLEERCESEGIDNISVINGRWEDDWEDIGINVHDVAIASRSLIVEDLEAAVTKLQRYARRRVYISTLVDEGPHDRRIIEAVGRKFHPGADYIIVYNFLRRMGIYANVAFTVNRKEKSYADVDEAAAGMGWMIHDMTGEEEERLKSFLAKTLVRRSGRLTLPYRRIIRWAVLWWEKDSEAA